MKIQLSNDLDEEEVKKLLKSVVIVEDGDYILMRKYPKLKVFDTEGTLFIDINVIDYIEAYDNTVYVHCKDYVYTSSLKLFEHLNLSKDLIRISKAIIVNKTKITEIRPSINMKFKILVDNKNLEVNRTYYYAFKDAFNI